MNKAVEMNAVYEFFSRYNPRKAIVRPRQD